MLGFSLRPRYSAIADMSNVDKLMNRNTKDKMIVLIGLMGSGKTTIGVKLAAKLNLRFIDSDHEIESEAGCSIEQIFETCGEAAFRQAERHIIRRLLDSCPGVLATGGGAFLAPETRQAITEKAISVWLRTDLDTLVRRCSKQSKRPLLQGNDMQKTLESLMKQRYPIYSKANIIVDSGDWPYHKIIDTIISELPPLIK